MTHSPCSGCKTKHRPFPGDGPCPNPLMLIGEAPGIKDSDRPYTGWAGKDFNETFLRYALKVERDDVYFTNVVKCRDARDIQGEIPPDLVDCCSTHWIPGEIRRCNPEVVVLMGAAACSVASVEPPIDLDAQHGIPLVCELYGRPVVAVPVFHPSSATHDHTMMKVIWEDFCAVREVAAGRVQLPEDPYPNPTYRELTDPDEVEFLLQADEWAIDTEGTHTEPWSLQFSTAPGTGFMIAFDRPEAMECLERLIKVAERRRPLVFFHFALHDLDVTDALGIPIYRYRDTMMWAYHLQMYSQGMKALAYRLCEMEMTSYQDITNPYAESEMYGYMTEAGRIAWPKPPKLSNSKGTGMYQPHSLNTRINRAVGDLLSGRYRNVSLLDRWSNFPPDQRAMAESQLGVAPRPSLSLVPRDIAVRYGCRDADATLRVARKMRGLRRQLIPRIESWDRNASMRDESGISQICSAQRTYAQHTAQRRNGKAVGFVTHSATTQSGYDAQYTGVRSGRVQAGVGGSGGEGRTEVARIPGVSSVMGHKLWGGVRMMGRPSPLNVDRLDRGALPMIQHMGRRGMKIDRPYFYGLSNQFEQEMGVLSAQVNDMVGEKIALGSADEVAHLLFDTLRLEPPPHTKKNRKGKYGYRYPVDDEVVSAIKAQHPVIPLVQEWSEIHKLKTSYSDVLPALADHEDRIHTNLKYTRVVSGRLSSSNPNLMAIPTRTDRGRLIRKGFIASQGCKLVSVDESQIEMRFAAHYSGDAAMIKVFRAPKKLPDGSKNPASDIHMATASAMFRLAYELLDKWKHRYPAKRVGFGVLFGITPEGLLVQLNEAGAGAWTLKQAAELIDLWFNVYEYIKAWMDGQTALVKRHKMGWDLWGRIRHMYEVKSAHPFIVEEALRAAGNFPIQSGAQGTMKLVMAESWERVFKPRLDAGIVCDPLIQIHDEIISDVDEDHAEDVAREVVEIVEGCCPMRVPIEANYAMAGRWGDFAE